MAYYRLDANEKSEFEREYNKLRNNVHQYESSNTHIQPCLRIKDPIKVYEAVSDWYPAYKISFIHHKGYWPNKPIRESRAIKEISHICGNAENSEVSLCIEISHMNLETHNYNIGRRSCHSFIRKYVPKYRHYESVQTRGTIYVNKLAIQINKLKKINLKKRCTHIPKCFINYGKI